MPRLKAAPIKRTSDRFHPDSEIVQNNFSLHDVDDDDDAADDDDNDDNDGIDDDHIDEIHEIHDDTHRIEENCTMQSSCTLDGSNINQHRWMRPTIDVDVDVDWDGDDVVRLDSSTAGEVVNYFLLSEVVIPMLLDEVHACDCHTSITMSEDTIINDHDHDHHHHQSTASDDEPQWIGLHDGRYQLKHKSYGLFYHPSEEDAKLLSISCIHCNKCYCVSRCNDSSINSIIRGINDSMLRITVGPSDTNTPTRTMFHHQIVIQLRLQWIIIMIMIILVTITILS